MGIGISAIDGCFHVQRINTMKFPNRRHLAINKFYSYLEMSSTWRFRNKVLRCLVYVCDRMCLHTHIYYLYIYIVIYIYVITDI